MPINRSDQQPHHTEHRASYLITLVIDLDSTTRAQHLLAFLGMRTQSAQNAYEPVPALSAFLHQFHTSVRAVERSELPGVTRHNSGVVFLFVRKHFQLVLLVGVFSTSLSECAMCARARACKAPYKFRPIPVTLHKAMHKTRKFSVSQSGVGRRIGARTYDLRAHSGVFCIGDRVGKHMLEAAGKTDVSWTRQRQSTKDNQRTGGRAAIKTRTRRTAKHARRQVRPPTRSTRK